MKKLVGARARAQARALFDLLARDGAGPRGAAAGLDAVAAALGAAVDAIRAQPMAARVLSSAAARAATRLDIARAALDAAGARAPGPAGEGRFALLAECVAGVGKGGGIEGLGCFAAEFGRLVDGFLGRRLVLVESARPLGAAEMVRVEELSGRLLPGGTRARFEARLDPALIGGFRVRAGSLEIDASARAALVNMQKELLAGRGGDQAGKNG